MVSGNINMNGATIQGKNVIVRNTVTGYGGNDGTIQAEKALLTGDYIEILNNVEGKDFQAIYAETLLKMSQMDKTSPEYTALQKLVSQGAKDDTATKKKKLLEHIASFTEGVLAGVITNMITK